MTTVTQRSIRPRSSTGRLNYPAGERLLDTELWQVFLALGLFLHSVLAFGAFQPGPNFLILALLAPTGVGLLLAPRDAWGQIIVPIGAVLYASWWLLSILWTSNMGLFVQSTKQDGVFVTAVILTVSLLPLRRVFAVLNAGFYFIVAWTFLATAMDPYNTMNHINAGTGLVELPGWHGSFLHKNHMTPYLILGLTSVISFEPRRWLKWASLGAAGFLIVMSQSDAGAASLAVILALYAWLRRYLEVGERRDGVLVALAALITAAVAAALLIIVPVMAYGLGPEITLTSRVDIWQASWGPMMERFWTGWGVGGMWFDQSVYPTNAINDEIGFVVFHAHNSFVELMLWLGLPGLFLYAGGYVVTTVGSLDLVRRGSRIGIWATMVCAFLFVHSLVEVAVLGPWPSVLIMVRIVTLREKRNLLGEHQ